MSSWKPCPVCGREPNICQCTSDMDFLGPLTKYRARCCDIDVVTEDPYETERLWNAYVDTYIKNHEEEGNIEIPTNYNNVSEQLTSNNIKGENEMDNTKLSSLRCKYCGHNLKEEFTYDDRTCSTVYSCDCEGAKKQKELERSLKVAEQHVEDLKRQLQKHKASSLYNKQYNEIMNELYNLEHNYHDIGKVENEVRAV